MIEKIQESEQKALEEKLEKRQGSITSAEQETKSFVKQMYEAVEFADNLAERCSSSDIMSNKDTLKQRNEELQIFLIFGRGLEIRLF